tara:strand:- start:94 stop:342 length:249 start_codon:yes stop_codon:yes gene_type:complete
MKPNELTEARKLLDGKRDHMSRADMAALLGRSPVTLWYYETGQREIPVDIEIKVMGILAKAGKRLPSKMDFSGDNLNLASWA